MSVKFIPSETLIIDSEKDGFLFPVSLSGVLCVCVCVFIQILSPNKYAMHTSIHVLRLPLVSDLTMFCPMAGLELAM